MNKVGFFKAEEDWTMAGATFCLKFEKIMNEEDHWFEFYELLHAHLFGKAIFSSVLYKSIRKSLNLWNAALLLAEVCVYVPRYRGLFQPVSALILFFTYSLDHCVGPLLFLLFFPLSHLAAPSSISFRNKFPVFAVGHIVHGPECILNSLHIVPLEAKVLDGFCF